MSDVELEGVTKRFGDFTATSEVSFKAEAGAFLSLLGPSGCGKTTTLRMIAGFERPDAGEIRVGGQRINEVKPWRRDLGVVFQNYALFPFLTVAENVAFGLKRRGMGKGDIAGRLDAVLKLVGLPDLGERYPRQLSGGQQQRVALARALVIDPRVLLLDEPLSNLDAKLRAEMRFELKRIQRESGVTSIFVTHDQEEALTLSDVIVVMNQGKIVATGTPKEIWETPGSAFVADFLGVENLFPAHRTADREVRVGGAGPVLQIEPRGTAPDGQDVTVGIRSLDIDIGRGETGAADNIVAGTVRQMSYRGTIITYLVDSPPFDRPIYVSAQEEYAAGDQVSLRLPADKLMLLRRDFEPGSLAP